MGAIYPTSLPWQVKHDFDVEGLTTIIANVDGEIIDGTTHYTYDFICDTLGDDDTTSRSVAVANAAFIVRACNAHDALVEALKCYLSDCTNDECERCIVARDALSKAGL